MGHKVVVGRVGEGFAQAVRVVVALRLAKEGFALGHHLGDRHLAQHLVVSGSHPLHCHHKRRCT